MAWYWKTLCALTVYVMLLVQTSASNEFRVGGRRGWVVPSGSETETYNQWAQRNRFQVGDNIYFKYKKGEDSVLEVTQEDYNTCNTSNPIESHNDGNTVFKFRHSGDFYFISGTPGNCEKGQKLNIVVMAADDHSSHAPSPATSWQGGEAGSPSPASRSPSSLPSLPPASAASPALASAASLVILLLHFVRL